jgi:hypothetical protein
MIKTTVLHSIFYDQSHGHKISKLYYKCTFLLKYSQIGCAYVVWWVCTVYLHCVIKNGIAIGPVLPIKYIRQPQIYSNSCHSNYIPVTQAKLCTAVGII